MKMLVVYSSKQGCAKKYADWIAQALGCDAKDVTEVTEAELSGCDAIVYGGSLMAGSIRGFKKFLGKLRVPGGRRLALYAVGMTNPEQQDVYAEVFEKNIPPQWKDAFKTFAFHGDVTFSQWGGPSRMIMNMLKKSIEKKPPQERSQYDEAFLRDFGKDVEHSGREQTTPLVGYMRGGVE